MKSIGLEKLFVMVAILCWFAMGDAMDLLLWLLVDRLLSYFEGDAMDRCAFDVAVGSLAVL